MVPTILPFCSATQLVGRHEFGEEFPDLAKRRGARYLLIGRLGFKTGEQLTGSLLQTCINFLRIDDPGKRQFRNRQG